MPDRSRPLTPGPGERGSSLVAALGVVSLATLLACALLFNAEVEQRSAAAYRAGAEARAAARSGLAEAVWRLGLESAPGAPPLGSRIVLPGLHELDAALSFDPGGLLANRKDDDGDGRVDEPDELNLARDWSVRLALGGKSGLLAPADLGVLTGALRGLQQVVPALPAATGTLVYSTLDPLDPDALTVRFLLDVDGATGDAEGDGPEVVFHHPGLATDDVDDPGSLSGPGGDGDLRDSPLHVAWGKGKDEVPARGEPVLVVRSTGRVVGGGHTRARLPLIATVTRGRGQAIRAALCATSLLDLDDGGRVDSYRSSQGEYGKGPTGSAADIGSNGRVVLGRKADVRGSVRAGGDLEFKGKGGKVSGDVEVGDDLRGGEKWSVAGSVRQGVTPVPSPCGCDRVDLTARLARAAAVNDNLSILPDALRGYRYGSAAVTLLPVWQPVLHLVLNGEATVILTGGTYFAERLTVASKGALQVGVDQDRNGLVDGPPLAPVELFVAGEVDLRGRGVINRGRPGDFRLFAGTGGTVTIDAEGDAELRGLVYARSARVVLGAGDVISGAVVGREVVRRGGDPVHFDLDLATAIDAPSRVVVLSLSEAR